MELALARAGTRERHSGVGCVGSAFRMRTNLADVAVFLSILFCLFLAWNGRLACDMESDKSQVCHFEWRMTWKSIMPKHNACMSSEAFYTNAKQ